MYLESYHKGPVMAKSRWRTSDDRDWLVSFYQELDHLRKTEGVDTSVRIEPYATGPKLSTTLTSFRNLSTGDTWVIASVTSYWPSAEDQPWTTWLFNQACKLSSLTEEAMAMQPHLI